jgi:hypothetical protein
MRNIPARVKCGSGRGYQGCGFIGEYRFSEC